MSTYCFPCASTLKMEAAQSSEVLVPNLHTAWYNSPDNHNFYLHYHENQKSCNHLGDWGGDWKIIEKCILRKQMLVLFHVEIFCYSCVPYFSMLNKNALIHSLLKQLQSLCMSCWSKTFFAKNIFVSSCKLQLLPVISTPELDTVENHMIHGLQLLHLYKPPPPYPISRPSSNSTPDLASKALSPPQPTFINPQVSDLWWRKF